MPSTKELRERRGAAELKFKNIVRAVEQADRDMTDEEYAECRKLTLEDQSLKERIETQERLAALGHELDEPADRKISGRGSLDGDGANLGERRASDCDYAIASFVRNAHGEQVPPDHWERSEAYGYRPGGNGIDVVLNKLRPQVGAKASLIGNIRNGMITADPARGGTLTAAGFTSQLEIALKQFGPMLETSTLWTSEDGRASGFPMFDDTGEAGELVGEEEESDEADIDTKGIMFGAHKLSSKIVRVSQEMIEDSVVDLAGEVGRAIGTRIGRGANALLTNNQTANGPRGIVRRATVGKTTAGGTAITADEVLDLIASLDPAYQAMPNCAFMMSPAVFAYLLKLKDSTNRYLVGDMENGANPKLRGWPVKLNPHMATALATGARTILFGDLSKYCVRIVRSIRLRTLTEKFAEKDQLGFVGFLRFDGDLLDAGTHPVKCMVQG